MEESGNSAFRVPDRVKNGTSAEEVAARLREMVHKGEVSAGDRLPPERDLAKLFGVSRPTLRAGIRSLSAVGILESRQGAGTFVSEVNETPILDSSPLRMLAALHGVTPDEMFEARLALELSIVELASKRGSDEQIALMEKELTSMRNAGTDREKFVVHENKFHQIIAAASGSRVLSALANMVRNAGSAGEHSIDPKDSAKLQEHIYRGIKERDSVAAGTAMREYLLRTQKAADQEIEEDAGAAS